MSAKVRLGSGQLNSAGNATVTFAKVTRRVDQLDEGVPFIGEIDDHHDYELTVIKSNCAGKTLS